MESESKIGILSSSRWFVFFAVIFIYPHARRTLLRAHAPSSSTRGALRAPRRPEALGALGPRPACGTVQSWEVLRGAPPAEVKVPACVNALTRKPYALLSGTMVFAAQELLRDNLSTPQNVKFAGAFPTPGSARAPLGRARRGAATVGVARTTRFFIPRRRWQPITAPDFQPNAFCHFSPKHPRRQIADPRSRPRRARCLF